MSSISAVRAAVAVGAVIFLVLVGGWVVRRAVGVVLRLAGLLTIVAVALLGVYVVYELVSGWQRAG